MRIDAIDCVGLLIDIQEKLIPHMLEKEYLLKRTSILIQGLQILDIPVIVTEQYTRGLGNTIEPIKNLFPGFHAIEKISFSCCDEPLIDDQLKWSGREIILLAGIETHVCVLQTVEDLLAQNKIPVVIEDCVSSININDKEIALSRMQKDGAIITSSESILFELCRHAGNERFKSISRLVK